MDFIERIKPGDLRPGMLLLVGLDEDLNERFTEVESVEKISRDGRVGYKVSFGAMLPTQIYPSRGKVQIKAQQPLLTDGEPGVRCNAPMTGWNGIVFRCELGQGHSRPHLNINV